MKRCGYCGSKISSNAAFCNSCGKSMLCYCPQCGQSNLSTQIFCIRCGRRLNTRERPQRNTVAIALLSALCAVFAVVAIAVTVYNNYDKYQFGDEQTVPINVQTAQSDEKETTVAEEDERTEYEIERETDVVTSSRPDPYSPSLSYKRMSGIHGSWLTDDSDYNAVSSAIRGFDNACERYMNYGDNSVFGYLKPGSTAYEQQTAYKRKHPFLKQYYTNIDVINTRTDNRFYYAWASESMDVYENGISKSTTDHWVYKLERVNNQWYIIDYTADPAY